MRKVLIGLLIILFIISIVVTTASAFVWSPPPIEDRNLIVGASQKWGPVDPRIALPEFIFMPKLPDWVLPLPAPTVRTDEIKMTLSDAERAALENMEKGECIWVYFVLPEEFDGQMLYWSSDNENVAITLTSILIDPLGRRARICCIASGTALITVKNLDESFFYQFPVTVN